MLPKNFLSRPQESCLVFTNVTSAMRIRGFLKCYALFKSKFYLLDLLLITPPPPKKKIWLLP